MAVDEALMRTTLRPRDFIDIVATRWPFVTSTILIFCTAAFLPTVATEYGRLTNPNIVVAVSIGLISVSVNGGILFFIRGWVGRTRALSPWSIVVILMAAGGLRGVVTSLIVAPTNLQTHSYFLNRVGLGAVSSPILLAVVALVVSRVVTSRNQRRRTTRDISVAAAARDRVLGEVTDANNRFVRDIDNSLRPAVDDIITEMNNGSRQRDALSAALDDLAENVVRPLSHSIARGEANSSATRGSIEREVFSLDRPTLGDLINPVFSALGVGLGGFSVMLGELTALEATVAALIASVSTYLFLLGARALLADRRVPTVTSIITVASIHAVVWIPAQFINDLIIFPDVVVINYSLLGLVATPLLGALYVLIVLGAYSSRNHLAALDSARVAVVLEQSEARRTAWLRQRHIAHTLHSSIQSRVHAQARMLRAGDGPLTETERSDTALSLRSVLTVIDEEPPTRVDAIRSIEELCEFWAGMCEISLTVDDESRAALETDADAAEAVSIVTLEIVSNAIRHGDAKAIDIDIIRDSPETVRIAVVNDGAALDPKHTPGLGMAIYEELTAWWAMRGTEHVAVDAVIAARGNNAST